MSNKIIIPLLFTVTIGLILGTIFNNSADALVPRVHKLVSVNNTGNGQGGNGDSPATTSAYQISANGKFVVFSSLATNLVSGDTNGQRDVFVRDLDNNTTTRVNVSTSGVQANNTLSGYAGVDVAISETGRYIAFASKATNLIDGQTLPAGTQIYLRDTHTNTTSLVTQKYDGTLGNADALVSAVSNDGRFVTWRGNRNTNLNSGGAAGTSLNHIYLADLKTRTFTLLNSGNSAIDPKMSCDGSLIVFNTAESLVPSDTDTSIDAYLVDTRNNFSIIGLTTTSNDSAKNSTGSSISCNGNFITFTTNDSAFSPLVSPTDSYEHLYLYDRIEGITTLVDTNGTTVGNKGAGNAGIDNNGNVTYGSVSTNITAPTTQGQLYLRHADTGTTEMLSIMVDGNQSNGIGGNSSLSADGKRVVYQVGQFYGTTLLDAPGSYPRSGDTNGYSDVLMSLTGL